MNPLKQPLDKMYAQLSAISSRDLARLFKILPSLRVHESVSARLKQDLTSVSKSLTNTLNLIAVASRNAEAMIPKTSALHNSGLTKTAACPQCGNEEFGPGSVVCEDCGYPQVKDKREPAAKAKHQPEEFEWPHLVELAKTRAENPGQDIRVYPEDARTEDGKEMIESEGGVLWWCNKCDTYATPNRPCDCTANTFGKESPKTEEEIQQRVLSVHLTSELVKIADQLDKDGLHEYASEIDSILFK